MKADSSAALSRWERLKRFMGTVLGVHEVLFLTGFGSFFYGIAGIWSRYVAFALCGFLLMAVAIGAIVMTQRKAGA